MRYVIGVYALVLVLALAGLGVYRMLEAIIGPPVPGAAVTLKDAVLVAAHVVLLWSLILIAPSPPREKRFRLTMESGVSTLNDLVVGTFNDEQWATLAGKHFLQLDRLDAPEYVSYRVEPAA